MKRSDLVRKQADVKAKFTAITAACEKENRTRTAAEIADWDAAKAEFKSLEREIADTDEAERFSVANDTPSMSEKTELKKMHKRYDFGAIIKAGGEANKLQGVEKELHQEFSKAWGSNAAGIIVPERALFADLADNIEDISVAVAPIESVRSKAMYRELGCTIYENLTGKLYVPNIALDNAAVAAEGVAVATDANTTGGVQLVPERYGLTKAWGKEYISVSTNFQRILQLFNESVDRGITKKVLAVAAAKNVLAGRGTGDANADMTWADVLSLPSKLNESISEMGKFVSNGPVFYKLAGTPKVAANDLFIIDHGLAENSRAFGKDWKVTGLVDDAADVIYAVWEHMHIGLFANFDVVIDPYTQAAEGKIKVTVARMADADMGVTAAASIRNANGL